MDPNDENMLRETYRLAKENNRMLHKIRRSAFISNLFSFIFYAALFAAPIWFYMTYLSSTVDRFTQTMNQMQGTTTQAKSQLQALQEAWNMIQSRVSKYGSTPTTTNQ